MNLEQQRPLNGSDPEPAIVIIDERSSDGRLGLFSQPVRPGGTIVLSTELQNTTLNFNGDSPLEGHDPVTISVGTDSTVPVLGDAAAKAYSFTLEIPGNEPQELQLQVSTYGLEVNGISVPSLCEVSVRVPGSLDALRQVPVRFLNVTTRDVRLAVTPTGRPSFTVTAKAGSETNETLVPDVISGKVAEIQLEAELSLHYEEETGGTEQADIYIEP